MARKGGSRGSCYTSYDGSDLAISKQPEAGVFIIPINVSKTMKQ